MRAALAAARAAASLRVFAHVAQRLGPFAAVLYFGQAYRQRFLPTRSPFTLRARRARYPLTCRPDTSDWDVFRQVFVDWEYDDIEPANEPGWVIDCGANVGYASAWFLSVFPSCRVVAIEPDPCNSAHLLRTVRPYGTRVTAIHGAIWSHDATLRLATEPLRDGREWSRHVRSHGDGMEIRGYSLPSLFDELGIARASILKMDIEGAETVLFRDSDRRWLDAVDSLAVELHRDSPFGDPTPHFAEAMMAAGFSWRTHGDMTICRRARR